MCLRNTRQQSDGKHDKVIFAVSECVLRARYGTVQQPLNSQEVLFACFRDNVAIDFDDCIEQQPFSLSWQGQPKSSESAR